VSDQVPHADAPASTPTTGSGAAAAQPGLRRVHRSPRYGAFLVTGALVGVFLAVVSGLLGTGDGSMSGPRLIGYLAVIFGLLGGLLGGGVAVVIERLTRGPFR
jgi:hypothetical protein